MQSEFTPSSPDASTPALQLVCRVLAFHPLSAVLWSDPVGYRYTVRDVRLGLDEGRVGPDYVLWQLLTNKQVPLTLVETVLEFITGEVMEAAHRIAQTACGPACSRCSHDTASHHGGYGACRRCGPAVCGGYVLRGAA